MIITIITNAILIRVFKILSIYIKGVLSIVYVFTLALFTTSFTIKVRQTNLSNF